MSTINHQIKVLLVDDDEDDFLIIQSQLAKVKNQSFKLDWVSNFSAAKEAINKIAHDVYLIDYRLGAGDGLELVSEFDLPGRKEPFIILTGAGDEKIERRAMKMGVADYLVKGQFDNELLSRVLRYSIERKHAETRRINELLELNRSKDEFIALASHQLRTPATAVKQYLGMVLEGYAGAGASEKLQQEMLRNAYESNERQIHTINDILRIARLDLEKISLNPSNTNLTKLIESTIKDSAALFQKRNQNIVFNKPKTAVMANVDSENLRMAIGNILDNASKYTPVKKRISVTLSVQNPKVAIAIKDEGVGISAENFKHLFRKFSRIDNPLSIQVGGNGLGLYWSKEIVTLHGGEITVESEVGKGSTFTIEVPKK